MYRRLAISPSCGVLAACLLLVLAFPVSGQASDAWWVFLDRRPTAEHVRSVSAIGAEVRTVSQWLSAVSVRADVTQAAVLRDLAAVVDVRPVRTHRRRWPAGGGASAPVLDSGSAQFQSDQVGANALHGLGLLGDSVRVGFLDTGFETTHRALINVRVGDAFDFIHNDDVVSDEPGQDDVGEASHGTQTLAIVAADLAGTLVGIAPRAEFYLAKTEDFTRDGEFYEAAAEEDLWVAGLEWCAERGCRVINSSVGYSIGYSFADLDGSTAVVSRAVAEAASRGVLVVTAAGNTDGSTPFGQSLRSRIWPPADAPDALTVGGATASGGAWRFSALGPTADGRTKPDVLALAVGVATVSSQDNVSLTSVRGTSFATPVAAGVAALLLAAFPDATPEDLTTAMRRTASQASAPDSRAGYGLIDAPAAFGFLLDLFGPASVRLVDGTRPALLGHVKEEALRGYLAAPHPNPARVELAIPLLLSEQSSVRVQIYDLTGRAVCTLLDDDLGRGIHTVRWDGCTPSGRVVAPGVYIVALTTQDQTQARQLVWKGR